MYDLKNRIAYFRTYGNLNIRKVDIGKVDFTAKTITHIPMSGEMIAEDLTARARP